MKLLGGIARLLQLQEPSGATADAWRNNQLEQAAHTLALALSFGHPRAVALLEMLCGLAGGAQAEVFEDEVARMIQLQGMLPPLTASHR